MRLPVHQNGGFEVHYIAKGHLHWEIEGRPFLVAPRSVFFTFPWERHGSCVDFEPGHLFHEFLCFCSRSILSPSERIVIFRYQIVRTNKRIKSHDQNKLWVGHHRLLSAFASRNARPHGSRTSRQSGASTPFAPVLSLLVSACVFCSRIACLGSSTFSWT